MRQNPFSVAMLAYVSMFFAKSILNMFVYDLPITRELLYDPIVIVFALTSGIGYYYKQKKKKEKDQAKDQEKG